MFIRFLNGLENKLGFLGIPGLLRGVAFLTGLTYILIHLSPGLEEHLILYTPAILKGEVWRLVTFLFIPADRNPLLLIFQLFILVFCGDALEHAWGTFKTTVYYMIGVLCTIGVALIFGGGTAFFLNSSIFLAFATLFPMVEFRVAFIFPVQVRWLGLIEALYFLGVFVSTDYMAIRACILVVFANYLLFFGPAFVSYLQTRRQVAARRAKFESASVPADEPMHRCKTCRRTENDDPDLDFRVAADGEEYCVDHLPGKPAAT
jgi:hypothetical protein